MWCPSLTPSARRPCGAAATRGGAGPRRCGGPGQAPRVPPGPGRPLSPPRRGSAGAAGLWGRRGLAHRSPVGTAGSAGHREAPEERRPLAGPRSQPCSPAGLQGLPGAKERRGGRAQRGAGAAPPGPGLLFAGSQGSTLRPTSSCSPIAGAGLPGSVRARLPAAGRAQQQAGRRQGLVQWWGSDRQSLLLGQFILRLESLPQATRYDAGHYQSQE